ncbi:MAG: hypothetical protein AB8B79_14550 [Granulosicoccus sp.]
MNTPNRPSKEPNDQDIAALFEAQAIEPPESLDNAVLAAAKESVAESSGQMRVPKAKPLDKTTHVKTTHRWFALAATVVVGVSVAPLLLKSPESSLDAPLASVSEEPLESAEVLTDISPLEQSADNGGAAGDRLLEESESVSNTSSSLATSTRNRAIQERVELDAGSDDDIANASQAAPSSAAAPAGLVSTLTSSKKAFSDLSPNEYRAQPETWKNEIITLESTGDYKKASIEYALFRIQFPDFEPDFKLRERDD